MIRLERSKPELFTPGRINGLLAMICIVGQYVIFAWLEDHVVLFTVFLVAVVTSVWIVYPSPYVSLKGEL